MPERFDVEPRAPTGGGSMPIGTAGGDLSGTYPNPTVSGLNGTAISATPPQYGQVLSYQPGSPALYTPRSVAELPIVPITNSSATLGQLARSYTGGKVEPSIGGASTDGDLTVGVYGASATALAAAPIYLSGQRAPITGLAVGRLYRSNTGTLVPYASLVIGEYSQFVGVSDGTTVLVDIGEPFVVTAGGKAYQASQITGTINTTNLPIIPKTLGGYGSTVAAGLTNDQVAIVAGNALTIGALTAAAVPTLDAAKIGTGTFLTARLPIIPKTLGGFGVDVSSFLTNDQVAIVSGSSIGIGPLTATAMILSPLVVTANTTLTASNRFVHANNFSGSITLTLPTSPTAGTTLHIIQTANTFNEVQVSAAGGNTIIDGTTTSISLSGYGSSALLQYEGGRWKILNLRRIPKEFTFTSAAANDYLGSAGTGVALASARAFFTLSGLVVISSLRLQTRSNVAANHTIKARSALPDFSSASDQVSATIPTGSAGVISTGTRVLLANAATNATASWIVLQATTTITLAVDGVLELFTL